MRFRLDFVTNSSSTAYVCDVCGTVESGIDMSLREAGMKECIHGHVFCERHMDNSPSQQEAVLDKLKYDLKHPSAWKDEAEFIKETEDLIRQVEAGVTDNGEDFEEFIEELYDELEIDYNCPSIACPICTMKNFTDDNLLAYLLKMNNKVRRELEQDIRNNMLTYDDFAKYIGRKI